MGKRNGRVAGVVRLLGFRPRAPIAVHCYTAGMEYTAVTRAHLKWRIRPCR
jgi:hypothetical protein